ncbi:hypothetical protein EMCRGX_G012079 [Ephydatia muelleri]
MKSSAFVVLALLVLSVAIGAAYNRCQVATSRAVPPGTDYIYVCPNVNGTVFLQMLVTVPGNAPTSPPNPLLASQGVIGDPSHKDTIQFRANVSNNNTIVNCTYLNSTSQRIVCGNSVMLSIYDRPQPPQHLQVRIQNSSASKLYFNITWTPPYTPPEVNVFYTAAVLNWSDPSKNITLIRSISDCFCIFPHPANPTSCYPYQFTVLAENAAGMSRYSDPVLANVATAPWITGSVEIAFSYVDGVTLNFTGFQDCSNSSIHYHIQFQSITMKTQEKFGPYSSSDYNGSVHLTFSTTEKLHLNSVYECFLTASNVAGSTSLAVIVYTTDVQSSTITGVDHQLNVTCFFAEGTLAKGCVVRLEKSGEVVYQMIPRVNGTAKGVIRTEFSVDCYNISMVDWEEDGLIGSVAVPLNLRGMSPIPSTGPNFCSNGSQSNMSNDDTERVVLYSVSSLIAFGLVVTTATSLAIVFCCFRQGICVAQHQQTHPQSNQSPQPHQGNGDKSDYAEPVGANHPTPYDNILIAVTKKSYAASHYNFLQRFIHPKLYPQPSHVYEEQDLHYNRLFKQQATPSCLQPHPTIAPACYETPSAGTNI